MRKPNFFLIGAPKCGTTALATYLAAHPQVYFPPNKEPWFFNTDMKARSVSRFEDYHALFAAAHSEQTAVGEGSTIYLYSDNAVRNIIEYNKCAKFIVMLRNPVDMVQSWHSQLVFTLDENIHDFEVAWRAQPRRRQGYDTGLWCRDERLLLYGDICALGTQLERLYSLVPPDRVFTVVMDDFKRSPKAIYESLLQFLNVPSDGRSAFPAVNESKAVRLSALHQLFHAAGVLKKAIGIRKNLGLLSEYRQANIVRQKHPVLSDAMRRELAEYFADEVNKMEGLLQRRLNW